MTELEAPESPPPMGVEKGLQKNHLSMKKSSGFTNPEALQTSIIEIFMESSSYRHNWLLTPFSAPLSSLENEKEGC